METLVERVRTRWEFTCERLGIPMHKEFPVIWNLYSRISEPADHLVYVKTPAPRTELLPQQRGYHHIGHPLSSLEELEPIRDMAENPKALEVGIWGHDMIFKTAWYDALAQFNEVLSAIATMNLLRRYNANESRLVKPVRRFILVSDHRTPPVTPDEKLMVDIDLSILGKSEEEFDRYEKGIREEYDWAPDADFNEGRKEFLKKFLQRKTIYKTDHFIEKYEAQAQANLRRAIKRLDQAA